MIEIFVVGCVMTIALFLAVFERKNEVKGDEVVSIGPGHWTVPSDDQKLGDTSTSSGSSDESDQESEPENQQQIATQDYARCVQLRLHRFGEYRTRKEVNDLLILLVYYYTVIIKVLGVLLSNQSKEQQGIVRNVSTVTLYKEEEEFPVDDVVPESAKKKKTKNEKQAEEVYMPICLRKDDEAMYHEASVDNLDILISQRQKIESYISHLSESEVDIVKAVPAALEKQPSITHDESNVLFNVSIENKTKGDTYEPLIKKDAIISDIESLQAHIGDPKDDVNNELESLKSKLGYDLRHKLKPEASVDESDASMPTLKSISIDDSDLDVSQITESEFASTTELESIPDKNDIKLVDEESVIPIVDLIEKAEKDNDQTPDKEPGIPIFDLIEVEKDNDQTHDNATVYENSYHTGAIPKYSHPETNKTLIDQVSDSVPPVIQVESIEETDSNVIEKDSLVCESKPVGTKESSKAEIVKLKSVEKDILDGSEDEDLEEDTEDSDVSIPDMKGSYTLHHEDYGVEEIYEDRDPLAFLLEGNEVEDDLSENFVDSFFSDDSVPSAPVADTTYQIDPILEEESEEDYSDQDEHDAPGPLQLKVPSIIEDKFALTFSKSVEVDDDDIDQSIDQSQLQGDEKIVDGDVVDEKKDFKEIMDVDVVEEKKDSNKDIHIYQNGNMQKEVLDKIKNLANKLDEIKNQELNVDCTIVEDITEDVVTIEFDNHLDIYGDKPCNSKLDQCKAFGINDNLDIEIDNKELTKEQLENGIMLSGEDENDSSLQSQFQNNTIEETEIVNNNTEIKEKSIETNYAKESENNNSEENNEMAIEFDTPDMHFDEVTTNYAKKNDELLSIGDINDINEMEIEFETPDMNSNEINYSYAATNENIMSIGDNNEMVIEFESPDIHFNEVKPSDHEMDITNMLDELSEKICSELPPKTTFDNGYDQNETSLKRNQRTSSDIDNSLISDKSEQLISEQESEISIGKGEEELLDISDDHEFSSIDRCKAFSADAEPPEDFEYEGEAEYQKTVKLENFKNLENLQAAVVSADECSHKIVLDVHEFRHGDLRVSACGETEILVEAVSEVPEHEAMQVRKFRQKFLLPETAAATDSIAALSSDGVLAIITPKKDGTTPSTKRKLPEDVETSEKSSKYMTKNDPRSNETEKSTIIDREMVECFMPILQRGNFFTDSIFQETRQDFNTAITEVLDKWGERSVHDPERGTHREEPKEDNQILVDIADFTNDGEVKINVMDEELVVEGRTKKAEGSATSVKTFIRRFTLAPDIDPSAVTSVVTPDGILEITTPKKTVMPKLKEFSIQVIIELIVEESRTSPRKDSKSRKKLKDKSPGKDTDSSQSRKKKKIPEDGESEGYQNQAAGVSCDDDLLNKGNSEKEIVKSLEVSESMALLSSNTGEDIQTGASKEGIEDSLGAKSAVTDENYDQPIIVSRDDLNSDESDGPQQTTESVESETQVHITDIKRFILEAHREFGPDDEAKQTITLETTDKNIPIEYKEESQQVIANTDEIDVQRKTVAKLDSNVSFDEEDDSDWTLITPKEKSAVSQDKKDGKQVEKGGMCESNVNAEIENASSDKSNIIDESQEDLNPIPVILNDHAQTDNYQVGGDFKKILSSFPENLELQSQDSSVEKENDIPIPKAQEKEFKDIKGKIEDPIIKEEKKTTKRQKNKTISNETKKMDHKNKNMDTKYMPAIEEVKLPEAYVTLATNDDYAIGALVLGHSLLASGTTRKLAIMITETVSLDIRPMLHDVFNDVIIVNVMDSHDSAHLAQLQRPELGVTFTKLHCWTLLQFSKCVFLDADMFVLQNPDSLFEYPELSAAPDVGWPDCFNSGMFVFVPNTWTYHRLLQHAATTGSFDGGDQGVLNTFFPNWNCISFIYNMVASAVYTYVPAYMNYGRNAKIVHFIGPSKPWHQTFNRKTGEVETVEGCHYLRGFLSSWWNMYISLVEPGISGIMAARRLLMERSLERSRGFGDTLDWNQRDSQGFARWEYGNPDYLGQDSYRNIQAHIEKKISKHEHSKKQKSSAKKQNKSQSSTDGDITKKSTESEEQVQEIIEVPENILTSKKTEELEKTPNLETEKSQKEDETSDWILVKSRRRRQSERNSESFEQQPTESTENNENYSINSEKMSGDIGKSIPSYSDILTRGVKEEIGSQSMPEKINSETSKNLNKNDVQTTKHPELEIEETTYWPEKRPYWNIKATPKDSEKSSGFKSRDIKSDEIDSESLQRESSLSQDKKSLSVRSKTKAAEGDENLSKDLQIQPSKKEEETDYDIEESKIWDMASLRYLGPKDTPATADNIVQKDNLTKQESSKKLPLVEGKTVEASYLSKPLKDSDKFESLYAQYSMTCAEKGISHRKPSEIIEEENFNEPSKNMTQKEKIDLINEKRKSDESSNRSSNNDFEDLLSNLDRKLDFASNLLKSPSSEMISGMTASVTAAQGLSVTCEADDQNKVYEKDILTTFDKKKIETHPEDAMKHDAAQQDAKKQAQDDKTSSGTVTAESEANKNKLSSDEVKSFEAKAASQKESKVSEQEGSKEVKSLKDKAVSEKESKASELEGSKDDRQSKIETSEASLDIATKESEKSEKKEISQDKASKSKSKKGKKSSSSKDQKEKSSAESDAVDELKSNADLQKPATVESSAVGDNKLSAEQDKPATTEASTTGKQELSNEQEKPDMAESSITGEQKLTAEQEKLATAEISVAGEQKLSTEQAKLATAESSAAGEQKLSAEQAKLATAESSAADEQKLSAERAKLATAESSAADEQKLSTEQQEAGTTEKAVSGDLQLTTEQQKLATADELKLSTDQPKLTDAKISGAEEIKASNEQQEQATSDSSATSELKSTTEQEKLSTAKDLQSKEDSSKSAQEKDISKPSTKEISSESDLPSSQEGGKDATSTSKKSVKEKPEVVVTDESVRSKKSTVKKDVSEKQETLSGKSSSTAKLDNQSSISSKRKEEEKSISAKDAKALFQASAAATGSTSDLVSAGSSTGSSLGLRGTRSMSSSYSTLPGSSSPSSGYLATGTKSIASGSFTFKHTEEYIKKKPPPRNRPFFNLRDFL